MGATTFATFDPEPIVLGTVIDCVAASAILAGHVVAFAADGADWTVAPATASLGAPLGVALTAQATAGGHVAVAGYGSVVKMMGALDNSAIDAGDMVAPGATAGMIIVAPTGSDAFHLGVAIEDIAQGANTGYVLINGPVYLPNGA